MSLRKKEVIHLLKEQQYDELLRQSRNQKKILSILVSLSYDKHDPLSWRAIESIGLITREISKSDPELVRNFAGRMLWMIRDESGGIGWSSPEILGEIVRNNPVLYTDIAPVIVSFHEEKMLTAGVLWAIGRIGKSNTEMVNYAVPHVITYLQSEDPVIRGSAAHALGEIGTSDMAAELEQLKSDVSLISFYEDGDLQRKTVGDITKEAIKKLMNQKSSTGEP
jgi:hypothetical protein